MAYACKRYTKPKITVKQEFVAPIFITPFGRLLKEIKWLIITYRYCFIQKIAYLPFLIFIVPHYFYFLLIKKELV